MCVLSAKHIYNDRMVERQRQWEETWQEEEKETASKLSKLLFARFSKPVGPILKTFIEIILSGDELWKSTQPFVDPIGGILKPKESKVI